MDPIEIRKAEIKARLDELIALAETETRNVTDAEQTEIDTLITEFRAVEAKGVTLAAANELRAKMASAIPAGVAPVAPTAAAAARTELRTEPYRKGGSESYFNDLSKAHRGDTRAADRLVENDRHRADMEKRAGTTTVAGAGGEFAPPLWQIDQFIALARPGRTFADLVNNVAIPSSVSSINIPKVTTGTITGTQASQNGAIANQDIVTTSVSTGITTVAGGVVVAQQILDQSPISMDDLILGDLARDLAGKIDAAIIAAVAGVSGLNAITYTNASPTSLLLAGQVQQGIDAVHQGNYARASAIVMRPDRWGRLLAAQDTTGRPLVVPNAAYGVFNGLGTADGQNAQGVAGTFRGLPVYLDPLIPVNLGAGTNQDEVFILDASQVNLYESAPKAEAFQQTYASTLSVYCRIYEYYGVIANRLPKAISLISGTGMIPGAYGL